MWEILLSLLWTLLVTGAILALAYWFTRHVVGRMAPSGMGHGRNLEVLEQVAIGKDQRLMLVRIGQRVCILASSPGGVTNLGELSEEERAKLIARSEGGKASLPDEFAHTLRRVLEQRKRGGGGSHGRMD